MWFGEFGGFIVVVVVVVWWDDCVAGVCGVESEVSFEIEL